ncbi:cadherin-like protein 26 [Megalops cyprinoides]|uniref:cadherin-like protein 26 n=1 Tax=Megalops cyprinoides TaxID=118141 RepID=UPI0018642C1A|nr:cadherin-like protein 26 [Megalops cyprinoides]
MEPGPGGVQGNTSTTHTTEILMRHKRAWIIDSFSIDEEHPGPFPYKFGTVTFEAVDQENNKAITRLAVIITVNDVNDNPPRFSRDVFKTYVEESMTQGTNVSNLMAEDSDKPNTPNSTFDYSITSVSPNTLNAEFYVEQQQQTGVLSFRGCLDYEKTEKYTVVVEAKDRGEVIRRSSSCTVIVHVQDKNNHMPTFNGLTGTRRVKEGESGISPLRLHVTDKDTNGTAAWRAKYTIHGDTGEHFKIETDPETNDGILTVIKPLDFEESAARHLSISVDNEEPYFSCQVKRKTSTGLWEVAYTREKGGMPATLNITIEVEDVDEPPEFNPTVKKIYVKENVEVGYPLTTFDAMDKDRSSSGDLIYIKGDDPGGWVKVDLKTAKITTAKILDRESVLVVNNTYNVIIYAVDKGSRLLTGTGTLIIHLMDENDNLPLLKVNTLDVCLSDKPTMTPISAYDLDEEPESTPFYFELLGDVEGKWSLDPEYGTTVNLVKERIVYSGHHELQLQISNMQGQSSVQNLSVTVCDCSMTVNCRLRQAPSSRFGGSAIGIMFVALLVSLVLLLLVLLLSCEKEKIAFPFYPASGDALLPSNIETPGTDCKIPDTFRESQVDKGHVEVSKGLHNGVFQQTHISQHRLTSSSKYLASRGRAFVMRNEALTSLIYQRLGSIQAPGQELCDYDPKQYAYEGDSGSDPELDAISIDGNKFDPDELRDLDPRFLRLATICNRSTTLHQSQFR